MPNQATISFLSRASKRRPSGADKAHAANLSYPYGSVTLGAARDGCRVASDVVPTHAPSSSQSVRTPTRIVTPAMTGAKATDTTFDLPDSTDWLSTTLPAFEPLEAALRCEVCKEFLSNPVITSCSHTFCSICIRRCIATDGRCPSCKSACSSDKLTPNIAVREVVMRFQEARPKALEMARAEQEPLSKLDKTDTEGGRKRKLGETDMDDGEPARHTRARQTRSTGGHSQHAEPIGVVDSDDGDDDFLPQGTAKCPICNTAMKAESVYNHLDVCPGQSASSQGRSTRSRTKNTFPNPLQRRQKARSPPPARLSQLNYALLKEGALRKKLQEIGIPNWGGKDLLKRRHIEWLNIYNSNCDADESVRKSKRQLVKELEEWEITQGGRADSKENKMMKKDFDGSGHAKSHKADFDDLIAKARAKRATPKSENQTPQPEVGATQSSTVLPPAAPRDPGPIPQNISDPEPSSHPTQIHTEPNPHNPYQDNESALSTIRAKVAAANETGSTLATLPPKPSLPDDEPPPGQGIGMTNPLGGPARKVPMFALPEQPVRDVDSSGATH